MPFATTRMQPEIITLSEVSQKEKDKYRIISLICGIQNMTQMNISMKKQKNKIKDTREQIVDCQGGKGWERGGVGVWG